MYILHLAGRLKNNYFRNVLRPANIAAGGKGNKRACWKSIGFQT